MDKLSGTLQKMWMSLAVESEALLWGAIKILAIFLIAKLVTVFTNRLIRRIFEKSRQKKRLSPYSHKIETIQSLFCSAVKYVIYFFGAMGVLNVLGLRSTVSSLLATAGIGGIAIAFGAQGLIKDIMTGFFLLFEDQFAVGEVVLIDGEQGTVEEVAIRTTRLKKGSGEITTIPNGNISKVTNYSRNSSMAVIDVPVTYETDIERAGKLIRKTALDYKVRNDHVLADPDLPVIVSLGESNILLRLTLRVKSLTNGRTETELRQALRDALSSEKIDPPYPKRIVIREAWRENY